MRLIKVSSPEGTGSKVAETAFSVDIETVSLRQVENLSAKGQAETQDVIDIETSTPKAKRFLDALFKTDFYDRETFSVSTRQPRSIVAKESLREITYPLVEPAVDIVSEFWQFSHLTYDFAGRVFIAAALLAYGLIEMNVLLIISGLLFIPTLPIVMAIGFGAWTRHWKLAAQGAITFAAAIVLLVAGGALVAAFMQPPLKFNTFASLPAACLISMAVGIAASLANIDDAGRRELIGLAAAAQIALIPVWFGICLVFGFPPTTGDNEITMRALSFFVNIITIIVSSLAVYVLSGAAKK